MQDLVFRWVCVRGECDALNIRFWKLVKTRRLFHIFQIKLDLKRRQ